MKRKIKVNNMKTIYEFLLGEHLLNEHLLKNKTAASTQDMGMGYVDLGLPSRLLWAKCNIGADWPYEYGDYFMWGSTAPNTNDTCSWAAAPFNDGYKFFNKEYFNSIRNEALSDNNLTLKYDAVDAIIGKGWQMPTKDDIKELNRNTISEWVENYEESGINGRLYVSKINEAELFIPASGFRDGNRYYRRNDFFYLWSSTFEIGTTSCACGYFSDEANCFFGIYDLYYGFCLRAVKNP